MYEKRSTTLNGTLLSQLRVGACALILHGGRVTRTSRVVAICDVGPAEVTFETMNTHYRLLLGPSPQTVEQAAICMAA